MPKTNLGGIAALLFLGTLIVYPENTLAQSCRIPQRFGPSATPSSMMYKKNLNDNLGDWGTIFLDADTDGCAVRARDFLLAKLQQQNLDLNHWKMGLLGGDVFLVTSAALRLGGRGLLTSTIHGEILKALASYTFTHFPDGSTCGRTSGNGCLDDYSVAAGGHAWAGTYLWFTQSSTSNPNRDSGWFRSEAKRYITLALSPEQTLCVHSVLPTISMCTACRDSYNAGYAAGTLTATDATNLRNEIYNNTAEVLNFEHGFEDPNYGSGNLPGIANAVHALEVAGDPFIPTDFQKVMAHGLLRTGQYHAPQSSDVCRVEWLNNCVGLACSMAGHCIAEKCFPPTDGCGENFGNVKYDAGMFPVRKLLDNQFALPAGNPVLLGSPYYQFSQFNGLGQCPNNKFSPASAFFNDGRYAGYYQLPYQWAYVKQPAVWGVNPAQYVNTPSPTAPIRGTATFSGWAFDGEGTLTAASLSFTLDGQSLALKGFTYGASFINVCQTFGLTNQPSSCPVWWSGTFTPPAGFATGSHILKVIATSQKGSVSTFQRTFTYQP